MCGIVQESYFFFCDIENATKANKNCSAKQAKQAVKTQTPSCNEAYATLAS